jgi:hypothetical protein
LHNQLIIFGVIHQNGKIALADLMNGSYSLKAFLGAMKTKDFESHK